MVKIFVIFCRKLKFLTENTIDSLVILIYHIFYIYQVLYIKIIICIFWYIFIFIYLIGDKLILSINPR